MTTEHRPIALPSPERRRFLSWGVGAALTLAAAPVLARSGERSLAFYNLHTGESLRTTYWQDGRYLPQELSAVNHILRDHYSNEERPMATALLDLLSDLQQRLALTQPFEVVSGYRSPATNAMLREHSSGVAKHSLHMVGEAIDVRLPHNQLEQLRRVADRLHDGGVGYYPHSRFVHLDVGRVRRWRG